MKTDGMLLDLKNDSSGILGRYIKLQSMSGYYSLPLTYIFLEVERPANVVLHYKASKKKFKSGEKKEG